MARDSVLTTFPTGSDHPTNGPLHVTYRDTLRTLSFYGDEARVVEVGDLGWIVSVTIVPSVDTGATTFSLLVPTVALPGETSSVSIETIGVTTMHYVFVAAIGHPQHETYATTKLTGSAVSSLLPL
jgi:hypothetical protein